jgi:hypothetical protein
VRMYQVTMSPPRILKALDDAAPKGEVA